MPEFKFFCPQCGRQIQCDTGYAGTQINCPACQQVIVVPPATRVASAGLPPVAVKSRALRNIMVVVAAMLVLAGLATAGWFGYAKIGFHNNIRHALKFNLNNRVEIPNDRALQFGDSPFTISLWAKTVSDKPYMSFISKRVNSMGDGWVMHLDHGQLLFYCAGCCAPKSQPVSVCDGRWHHLAVTRADGALQFYLDGKNVGSGEDRCNHNDNNPIHIGMDGGPGDWNFAGELAEVHLYGRALSSTEIAAEWNNGRGFTRAVAGGGLIAGYHFDEGQGSVAKDFSGNHHDGKLINNPVRMN